MCKWNDKILIRIINFDPRVLLKPCFLCAFGCFLLRGVTLFDSPTGYSSTSVKSIFTVLYAFFWPYHLQIMCKSLTIVEP